MTQNELQTIAAVIGIISGVMSIFSAVTIKDPETRKRNVLVFFIVLAICALIYFFVKVPLTNHIVQQAYAPDQDLSLSNYSSESNNSTSIWLEDLSPIDLRTKNFFIGQWKNRRFSIQGVNYSHGIGMYLNNTNSEILVNPPPGNWKDTCGEVSIEYQLDKAYRSMSFNIGADDSEPKYYGDQDTHGVARVIISDEGSGVTLYDSNWFDYSFSQYDISLDLREVDTLCIALQACGGNYSKYHTTLNIALVDALLYLS
jgi:hypothetical protein